MYAVYQIAQWLKIIAGADINPLKNILPTPKLLVDTFVRSKPKNGFYKTIALPIDPCYNKNEVKNT